MAVAPQRGRGQAKPAPPRVADDAGQNIANIALRRAGKASSKQCATRVREAVEIGGRTTLQRHNSAQDYGPSLQAVGFNEVRGRGRAREGDVVVMRGFSGHPHGHMQVCTRGGWVSDFPQRGFYPGRAYRQKAPAYRMYRPPGTHNSQVACDTYGDLGSGVYADLAPAPSASGGYTDLSGSVVVPNASYDDITTPTPISSSYSDLGIGGSGDYSGIGLAPRGSSDYADIGLPPATGALGGAYADLSTPASSSGYGDLAGSSNSCRYDNLSGGGVGSDFADLAGLASDYGGLSGSSEYVGIGAGAPAAVGASDYDDIVNPTGDPSGDYLGLDQPSDGGADAAAYLGLDTPDAGVVATPDPGDNTGYLDLPPSVDADAGTNDLAQQMSNLNVQDSDDVPSGPPSPDIDDLPAQSPDVPASPDVQPAVDVDDDDDDASVEPPSPPRAPSPPTPEPPSPPDNGGDGGDGGDFGGGDFGGGDFGGGDFGGGDFGGGGGDFGGGDFGGGDF